MQKALAQPTAKLVPACLADKRFGRYKREKYKSVRRVDVREDEVLTQLIHVFRKFKFYVNTAPIHLSYSYALDLLKDLTYSATDVENFSIALAEFQDEKNFGFKAGVFLSELINNGQDSDFVIHTTHLSSSIDFLGYKNTKNIIVDGKIGDCIGYEMHRGLITVNGNADDLVGWKTEKGIIIVNGNIGGLVGERMDEGEIHIEGTFVSLGNIRGGRVYHKGELIVDKPPIRDEHDD